MILRRLTTIAIVVSLASSSFAQTTSRATQGSSRHEVLPTQEAADPVDPFWNVNLTDVEGFRHVLMTWATSVEDAFGMERRTSLTFAETHPEVLAGFLDLIENPAEFYRATGNVVARLEASKIGLAPMPEPESLVEDLSSPGLGSPFPPDYPPNSGAYKTVIIDGANAFGLATTFNNRCDGTSWGDYVGVWYPIYKVIDASNTACIIGGCDPTGIACGIACAITETARLAVQVATVPVDLCDIHAGAVDSAEIEAGFENTKTIISDIAHVHGDLDAHDANIDAKLAAHDTNIDGDLAAHNTNLNNHNANLNAHDLNIDTDLQNHDADIKALVGVVQFALDNKVELRRVHLQVLEVENRREYMVVATEAGAPVPVDFLKLQVFDDKTGAFVDLANATVANVDLGIYVVALHLSPSGPDKIFRFGVRHDEVVDHFGEIVFHRNTGGNLDGPGVVSR